MFPFSHCKYWGVGGRQEVGSQVVCTWSFWEICCFFNQKKRYVHSILIFLADFGKLYWKENPYIIYHCKPKNVELMGPPVPKISQDFNGMGK